MIHVIVRVQVRILTMPAEPSKSVSKQHFGSQFMFYCSSYSTKGATAALVVKNLLGHSGLTMIF